jgi:hypothetical protein
MNFVPSREVDAPAGPPRRRGSPRPTNHEPWPTGDAAAKVAHELPGGVASAFAGADMWPGGVGSVKGPAVWKRNLIWS